LRVDGGKAGGNEGDAAGPIKLGLRAPSGKMSHHGQTFLLPHALPFIAVGGPGEAA